MIRIVDRNNLPIDQAIGSLLGKVLNKIQQSGKVISDALKFTTQRHFQKIYPNSNHYNPKKVINGNTNNGQKVSGEIVIDVPGITRAYRDLHISPKNSKHLTIPLHRSAYGKRATEFSDLFVVTKKNGKKFLAQKNGNGITFMYFLANSVHQKRDKRLMPSDETFANNIFSRINVYLNRTKI